MLLQDALMLLYSVFLNLEIPISNFQHQSFYHIQLKIVVL